MIIAVDFDNTLWADGEWLDGAKRALKMLRRQGHKVIVHSCRARYAGGEEFIRETLKSAGFDLDVTSQKPDADAYVDDKSIRFEGDWTSTLRLLRSQF